MYRSGGTRFFVYPSRYQTSGQTQMSWVVGDIKAKVAALRGTGIEFVEFDGPGSRRRRHEPERTRRVDGIFLRPGRKPSGLSQIG